MHSHRLYSATSQTGMLNSYTQFIIRVCKSILTEKSHVIWSCGFSCRSCDFVGAIHDRVTNDAGGGGGCRTRALQHSCKHPRLIVESLPSSTLPNRLDFKPTGKIFVGQLSPGCSLIEEKTLLLFRSVSLRNL